MNVVTYLYQTFYNKKQKKEILDPLTTIIRLAVLSFKNDGTKIGISNNTFYLQEPNILQAPIRWGYGDKRDDLHNLYKPIEKCLEWYNIHKYPFLRNIYLSAIDGLNKLKISYSNYDNESSIISHSLSHYSNIILDFLGETKKEFNIVNNDNDCESKPRYEFLKNLWTIKEIKVISDLFGLINKNNSECIIKTISCLLEEKDRLVQNYVNKLSTTLN